MKPPQWTRVHIDVAGGDSDSDDAGDSGLTALGRHCAGPDRRRSTALVCTGTAPQPVLVDARKLAWRSDVILDAVDEIRNVTQAWETVDTPSNRRVFDAATRIRGAAKATWGETHEPSARRLRSGRIAAALQRAR